ncbi:MAG: hypothetical protein ACYC1P_05370 [Gaiellaceae bacterium]
MTEPLVRDDPEATAFTESILDNLSAWTVVALLIGVLYLVWATLEILGLYVGDIPSVGP